MADDSNSLPAVRHGLYAKSPRVLAARARKVGRLVRRMRDLCPWFEDSDVPACKAWAELQVVGDRILTAVMSGDITNSKGEPKRLIDVHRAIRLAQLSYARCEHH